MEGFDLGDVVFDIADEIELIDDMEGIKKIEEDMIEGILLMLEDELV